MPSNLIWCVKNAIDFATITGNPVMVATLPPSNLKLPARARVARTTSTAQQEIKFTWGGNGWFMNFLKLSRHNLEVGSTWRVQLFADAAWTNQIYDSGVLPAFDYVTLGDLDFGVDPLGSGNFDSFLGQMYSVVHFNRLMALSGIVTLANSSNSAGYMEASRLFAGDYYELSWNPETADFGWDESTQQSRSEGGTLRSDGTAAFRKIELQVNLKDEVECARLRDMLRYAGLRKDTYLNLYPEAGGEKTRDHTMLCKLVGKLPVLSADSSSVQKTRLSFQEV